eukprot:3940403-Rhodomonas_salina.3
MLAALGSAGGTDAAWKPTWPARPDSDQGHAPAVAPLVPRHRHSVPRRHRHPSPASAPTQPPVVEPGAVVGDVGARAVCPHLRREEAFALPRSTWHAAERANTAHASLSNMHEWGPGLRSVGGRLEVRVAGGEGVRGQKPACQQPSLLLAHASPPPHWQLKLAAAAPRKTPSAIEPRA